jgi:O-antigen/teichoic acid export membrane protein
MLNILKNKVIVFIATRYFSYFLQFLNSLIIAFTLGPYYLGIWGFLNLILQYLAFGNFGIENALNVALATGDIVDEKNQSALVSNSLIATFFSSLFLMITGLLIYLFNFHLFEKFLFSQYMIFIIVIACLNYFNLLFVNLFRTYSHFTPISIFQLIIQLFQLPICFC